MTLRVDGREERTRLRDIGLGGAGIEQPAPIAVGSFLALVLHAPNRWDPLVLSSRVAWTHSGRMGLAFEEASDADVYALYELLAAQVFDK